MVVLLECGGRFGLWNQLNVRLAVVRDTSAGEGDGVATYKLLV